MRKGLSVLLAVVLCFAALSGCAKEEVKSEKVRVAMLLPGEVTDGGWNAEAYKGLEMMKEQMDAETTYVENVALSDMQEMMRNYATDGYDYVIGHGFEFADSALAVAPEFEDTKFILNSATVSQAPNVASCNTDNKQQGFLAGVFAAKMTKTGQVGCVAGIEIPAMAAYIEGAELGAAYVDPSITYVSVYVGSTTDVSKSKELSRALVQQGADVLLPYASQCDNGVYETATENDVIAVGVISDRYPEAPDNIPTSIKCDIGDADFSFIRGLSDGSIDWEAKVYGMGVKEGTVAYFDLQGKWVDEVPKDTWDYCKKVEAALADGTLDISETTMDTVGDLPDIS